MNDFWDISIHFINFVLSHYHKDKNFPLTTRVVVIKFDFLECSFGYYCTYRLFCLL